MAPIRVSGARCNLRGVSDPGPTPDSHGHTPPDEPDLVAPGVGTRLAAWTLAAMGLDAVESGADDEPAHRRVAAAVEALRAHAPAEGVAGSGAER